MTESGNGSILLLLSGGVDSTALIHYYQSRNFKVVGLHIQYSQENNDSELESARKIAEYYNIEFSIINLGFSLGKSQYEYHCRNAIFILTAASTLPKGIFRISLGVHSGVEYYDSSDRFLLQIQNVLDGYYKGIVTVESPFISFTKLQIYEYCKVNKIPMNLTYSCEVQNNVPCGICPSCKDRRKLNECSGNL